MMNANVRLWLRALAVSVAVGLCGVIAFASWSSRTGLSPIGPPDGVHTGIAAIGGPFALVNPRGQTVTDRDFHGRSIIVYFGWTRDPDLTPAALQVLTAALTELGRKSEMIVPVFISLDPEHDKGAVLQAFLQPLHPRLVGLTGTDAATRALTEAYKLYQKRIPDASLPGGYSIDHASLYYVMGSDGVFRGLVPYLTDSAVLAKEILRLAGS
jgi:cytochrome oxidase Cu insertion factor (SCO1/SenC/PrrC family)